MKVLLFDNPQKSLRPLVPLLKQQLCQTATISDPVSGLKLMQKHQFDIVVVAENITRTSVENLLKAISLKFPKSIRITVSNEENKVKHQFTHYDFILPFEPFDVINTILSLQDSHKLITKDVVVKSVAKVKTLPTPPKVYLQLNALLKKANADSEKAAEIITQDPALTAKVLQFSNNTFATPEKPLTSISEAITKMGLDTLCCIVMTAELFSYQPDIPNFSILDEQLHALATARFAASLVSDELKQDTMLAGLLHGLGKLVLFDIDQQLTLKYFENNARKSEDVLLEQRIFATDHAQVGAYLLHTWCFPYYLIDAVLNYCRPGKLKNGQFGITQAVYVAHTLLKELPLDKPFAEHYQLTEQLDQLQRKALKFK